MKFYYIRDKGRLRTQEEEDILIKKYEGKDISTLNFKNMDVEEQKRDLKITEQTNNVYIDALGENLEFIKLYKDLEETDGITTLMVNNLSILGNTLRESLNNIENILFKTNTTIIIRDFYGQTITVNQAKKEPFFTYVKHMADLEEYNLNYYKQTIQKNSKAVNSGVVEENEKKYLKVKECINDGMKLKDALKMFDLSRTVYYRHKNKEK